jgi:hypothetical protein
VNLVLVIVSLMVAILGALALWVWVMARLDERQQRRELELSGAEQQPVPEDAPRHMQGRNRAG